jgi:hypothetical protein
MPAMLRASLLRIKDKTRMMKEKQNIMPEM